MKISELPHEIRKKALLNQKNETNAEFSKTTDDLFHAFDWRKTPEGIDYWRGVDDMKIPQQQNHYDNSKGSLYQFCEQQQLNSYEFDLIKRIMRCRKKGNFIEDLEKTKFLIDLYIKETKCES